MQFVCVGPIACHTSSEHSLSLEEGGKVMRFTASVLGERQRELPSKKTRGETPDTVGLHRTLRPLRIIGITFRTSNNR